MTSKLESEISKNAPYHTEVIKDSYTKLLGRNVELEIFLPHAYADSGLKYPLLLLNDGQDNKAVKVKETIEVLTREHKIKPIIVVGVKAADRLQEYGTAAKTDYLGRGNKAKAYTQFVTSELLPYLCYTYPLEEQPYTIAGYSMGGLSAFDIAWNHPEIFNQVGVFSGSFWWRKRDTRSMFYSDKRDRLMHSQVRKGKFKEGLKFWFQTGALDETDDRNNNGIIDSIDDTLDLIAELTRKGYRPFHDIHYYEMKDGKHNTETWSVAMPKFLEWAFGMSKRS